MARLDEAVSCPSCGARNKGKWEFCARCGESLQGAESVVAAKKPAPAARSAAARSEGGPTSPLNNVLFGVVFAALVATVVFAVRYSRANGPMPAPTPAAFTVPTQPGQPTPP